MTVGRRRGGRGRGRFLVGEGEMGEDVEVAHAGTAGHRDGRRGGGRVRWWVERELGRGEEEEGWRRLEVVRKTGEAVWLRPRVGEVFYVRSSAPG